jgi:hypothetical protein
VFDAGSKTAVKELHDVMDGFITRIGSDEAYYEILPLADDKWVTHELCIPPGYYALIFEVRM